MAADKISLAPMLLKNGPPGQNVAWVIEQPEGTFSVPGKQTLGLMPITLPHGHHINSLRVTGGGGSGAAGELFVDLVRQPIVGFDNSENVVRIHLSPVTPSLDTTVAAVTATATVDNDQFYYYLSASLSNISSIVTLSSFQIAHSST